MLPALRVWRCQGFVPAISRAKQLPLRATVVRVACASTARHKDRHQHNEAQARKFSTADIVDQFLQPLPADIEQRLERIVAACPALNENSRVIDVGSGTGCLIPHYQRAGVRDILAVELSPQMLAALQRQHASSSTLGNDKGVRCWCGDIVDVPMFMGGADAVFFNAVFGNVWDQREALLHATRLLKPGGHIVISHPLGKQWHEQLRAHDVELVPHALPHANALQQLIADLPLQQVAFVDERDLYIAVLQVPEHYRMKGAPLVLEGEVVKGFQRGSRKMGTPTANIDPEPLLPLIANLPRGVYFGWAKLAADDDQPEDDARVHKMVMNVGKCPTFTDGCDITVEAHILHKYSRDFYGQHLRLVVLGFIRPESKFATVQQLVSRIKTDIGLAKTQLEQQGFQEFKQLAIAGDSGKH